MLSFSLLGFPIRIHWLFWVNSALLGGAITASSPTQIQGVLIWMAVVFVSILIHELGHAFVIRRFGDRRVEIALYAFGGLAIGSVPHTRGGQVVISAAGPLVQIAVGALVWFVFAREGYLTNQLIRYAIYSFVYVSVFWGALNLLPIIPLDGGRIFEAVVGPAKVRTALWVSLVCSLALAVYLGLHVGALFATLFFGLLAYNNWQRLNHRGQFHWMDVR